MIVTISGWLYISGAVGVVLQFPDSHGFGEKLASLLGFGLSLAAGVGLLKRLNWARWIAIGVSLLTWTAGSLLFVWFLIYCFRMFHRAHRVSFGAFLLFLFCVALIVAMLWLSKRLFEYLTSEDGHYEFDTPETEQNVVVKSTMAYIAYIALIGFLITPSLDRRSGNVTMAELQAALHEASLRQAQAKRDAPRREAELPSQGIEIQPQEIPPQPVDQAELAAQRYQERVEARERERLVGERRQSAQQELHRKTRELFDRKVRDRSHTDAQFDADVQRLQDEFAEERASTQVLKCRDSAGSISYTQGYCPSGTRLVETQTPE